MEGRVQEEAKPAACRSPRRKCRLCLAQNTAIIRHGMVITSCAAPARSLRFGSTDTSRKTQEWSHGCAGAAAAIAGSCMPRVRCMQHARCQCKLLQCSYSERLRLHAVCNACRSTRDAARRKLLAAAGLVRTHQETIPPSAAGRRRGRRSHSGCRRSTRQPARAIYSHVNDIAANAARCSSY